MNVLSAITGLFEPVAKLVDDVHTSTEEKQVLQAKMKEIELATLIEVLGYEKQLMESQKDIIVAEAQGGSWLQKSWRPITMLTFLGLVVMDSFGWLANPLASEAWVLLQIGLGGYVAGRSLEKVVPKMMDNKK